MDLALPEDVQQQLQAFEELLDSLEGKLKPFTGPGSKQSIAQLEPLDRAQTHLALANAAHALFQLFLKASGADPAEHETAKEQERLKQYGKKVRKAAAAKELKESRRSLEVNVAAVNRFITAAVPDLTRDQRAALKEAGRKRGAAQAASSSGEAAHAAAAFLQQTAAELGVGLAQPEEQQQRQQQQQKKKKRRGTA